LPDPQTRGAGRQFHWPEDAKGMAPQKQQESVNSKCPRPTEGCGWDPGGPIAPSGCAHREGHWEQRHMRGMDTSKRSSLKPRNRLQSRCARDGLSPLLHDLLSCYSSWTLPGPLRMPLPSLQQLGANGQGSIFNSRASHHRSSWMRLEAQSRVHTPQFCRPSLFQRHLPSARARLETMFQPGSLSRRRRQCLKQCFYVHVGLQNAGSFSN
jgi:hypothetical protein